MRLTRVIYSNAQKNQSQKNPTLTLEVLQFRRFPGTGLMIHKYFLTPPTGVLTSGWLY